MTNGNSKQYTESHGSNPTVTLYSIASVPQSTNFVDNQSTNSKTSMSKRRTSQSIDESRLVNGGLCTLHNLGNTVRKKFIEEII